MIDGRTGNHIWAERYDRKFEDLFALQDQITMGVMEILKVKFMAGFSDSNISTSLGILFGEKAVEDNPNESAYYLSLGLALRSAGRYEEANVSLEIALRLNPLRPLPYANNLAWSCLGNKQYDKAIL